MAAYRYMIGEEPDGPLVSMDLREFVGSIAARTPSPGGGTVAALTCTMVLIYSVFLLLRLRVSVDDVTLFYFL